tara:strand:+ start:579 stop:1766 length:1188 start_codon:yes stop_codon:yes gene_type:complete
MHIKKIVLFTVGTLIVASVGLLHFIVPGILESSINRIKPHEPYVIRPDAQALHDTLFIADLHTDSMLWKRNFLKEASVGHVDLPRLQRGNVALQVFSATTKSPEGQNYDKNTSNSDRITALVQAQMWPLSTWDSIYERAKYQLEKLYRIAEDSDGTFRLLLSKQDMASFVSAREQGKRGEKIVAGIYLIEGAHPLEGDLNNLDKLFDQGLRITGLTHFFDNRLGGSLHGVSGEGLTPFGESVIKRANELGLMIDVAHASPQIVNDVLELSQQPLILSHGGLNGICEGARNLDDKLMKRFAEKGGLIGIGYWDAAVCDFTPEGVVKSIRYGIDLLGVEHIALGSDYDGATEVLFDTSELAILTQTMLDQGFTEHEIRMVMGENVKRFMLANLPDQT